MLVLSTFLYFFERAQLYAMERRPAIGELPLDREIPNFYAVNNYLFRGALPTPFGMVWLKKHGVKTIIDLREAGTPPVEGERISALDMGFNYVNLPVKDFPTINQLQQFESIVAAARAGEGSVFVHCNYGSDRTGFFVFMWRIFGDRWRLSLALCELFERGFLVHKFSESKTKPLSDPANW